MDNSFYDGFGRTEVQMKEPNSKNGALTFAFTIAGGCIGYAINQHPLLAVGVIVVAGIGGFAAWLGDSE